MRVRRNVESESSRDGKQRFSASTFPPVGVGVACCGHALVGSSVGRLSHRVADASNINGLGDIRPSAILTPF
jgi:hypothetical protein